MTSFVIKQGPLSAMVALVKSQCVDAVDVQMSAEGMDVYAMDPSSTSLVSIKLPKGAFEGDITDPTDFITTIEFMEKCSKMGALITMTIDNGTISASSGRSRRSAKLLAMEEKGRHCPKVELTKSCEVQSDDLRGMFGEADLKTFGERYGLKVTFSHTELRVEAKSETESFSDGLLTLGPEEDVVCRYSPKLVLPLMKALPKGMSVTLSTEVNCPLKMTASNDELSIMAFLAPMIVEEDELDG